MISFAVQTGLKLAPLMTAAPSTTTVKLHHSLNNLHDIYDVLRHVWNCSKKAATTMISWLHFFIVYLKIGFLKLVKSRNCCVLADDKSLHSLYCSAPSTHTCIGGIDGKCRKWITVIQWLILHFPNQIRKLFYFPLFYVEITLQNKLINLKNRVKICREIRKIEA